MGLEAVTYISDFVITNPVGATDPKSQGDDHIRNIKKGVKATFPNLTGAMNATQGDLNQLASSNAAAMIADIAQLADPNADRILFWDDSAGAVAALAPDGTNVTISGTTLGLGAALSLTAATFSGTVAANLFSGSGASLTSLNGSNISSGTVADGRLSSNIPLKNGANTFTASQIIMVNTARLELTSANTDSPLVRFSDSASRLVFVGLRGGDQIIAGDAAGDVILRTASGGLSFTGDGGSTMHFRVTSAGVVSTALNAGHTFLTSAVISPSALSSSQNDYAPTGHASATVIRLDPGGNSPAAITGFAGGVAGRRVIFVRIAGTTGTIQFTQESASSSAENRFAAAAASASLTTTAPAVEFIYDGTTSRWIPIAGAL